MDNIPFGLNCFLVLNIWFPRERV